MNLGGDCDLLYISCQLVGRTRFLPAFSRDARIPVGNYADTWRADTQGIMVAHSRVQRERRVLRGYAFRRQRPTIPTNAIIIAATLITIRYSIVLSHCLTGDEPESPV